MITFYPKDRQTKISKIWIGVGGLLIVFIFALIGLHFCR